MPFLCDMREISRPPFGTLLTDATAASAAVVSYLIYFPELLQLFPLFYLDQVVFLIK